MEIAPILTQCLVNFRCWSAAPRGSDGRSDRVEVKAIRAEESKQAPLDSYTNNIITPIQNYSLH
jgi:hypothetical protein